MIINKISIEQVIASEILDSRGYPTVETTVVLSDGSFGTASVPSGASTGTFEAVELRDNDKKRFFGKGVLNAVDNVNSKIAPKLIGAILSDQSIVDTFLIDLDGTENKAKLGANAVLSVSLAYAYACANHYNMPLYRYLGGNLLNCMPIPMMNILNGGVHADNKIDVQEFMVVPVKASTFRDALFTGAEIYHALKNVLKEKGLNINVGDEGGVAPQLDGTEEALDSIILAIEKAGYVPGEDVKIALDVAASELYKNDKYTVDNVQYNSDQMIEYYKNLISKYPIMSIEDPLAEEDWAAWSKLSEAVDIMIVGDDLYVTNTKRLQKGIEYNASNAILIKLNQIGTVTEAAEAVRLADDAGMSTIISHRSGETSCTVIADFAVAMRAGFIKSGAPARGERVAKYNRLLQIENEVLCTL